MCGFFFFSRYWILILFFFFSSRRRHTRLQGDWSSDVCSSDLSQPGKRHLTIKHPVGVVAAISPWNFPVTLQARKLAPALAAGCTIVSRPASQTPLCLIQVFECMVDAGLPPGVANLVIGPAQEMADEFLDNRAVRKVSFTGS